jgi:hypothetical protein
LEATRTQESKTTSPPVRRAAAEGPGFFGGRLEANPLAALHRRLGNAAAAAWAHDAVPAVQGEAQLLPQAGEVAPVMRQVEEEEEPVLTQVEEEEEEPVQAQVEEEEEPEVQTQAEEEEEEEEPVAAKSELTVGAPGDRYEREADALAGRVMAMPEAAVQRQELEEEEPPEVQAQVEEEEEEEEPVLTQVEEEEKEPVQAQVEEEEEPEVQTQAEEEEEEEEPVAAMSELTVGAPGDRYEREADALAGRVMAMPEAAVQRRDLEEEPPEVQAQVEEEEEPEVQTQVEEEEKPVQTKGEAAPAVTPPIRAELEATRGSGEPLARDVRGFMEPRFGRDFDAVRVHTDARAGGLARQLRAQAFTRGADIYFASGKYGPYSPAGKRLLAHELTHVIQQRSVPDLQRRITSGGERDYFEREADAAAEKVVSGNEKPGGLPITPVSVLTLTGERSTSTSSVGNGGAIQLWGWGWVSRGIRSVARGVSKGVEWVGGKIAEGGKFLLGKIAPWFKSIPGYDLLTLILGKDPVSGKEVKRGGVAVVRAVMGLVPGGRAMFENLNKAGAITRAVDWISTEIAKLDLSFAAIKALFGEAWNALSPADIFNPRGAFAKLKRIFYPPIARILAFARKIGGKVLEFIFEGVLTMVGAPVKKIMAILNKGAAVLNKILKNPIGFVKNLVKAVGLGVKNFAKNILKHLKKGIVGWLFGALKSADIELPKEFDLKGVFFLVAQILGLTYANIRAKIVEKLGPGGERIVSAIEKGVSFVRDLVKRGPVVLWEKVQESLSNIKDMVFGAIKDWVVKTIVVKAIEKVLSFLNPAGAVVQAIIAIYNTVMFFVERYQQIVAFAEAVFDSIAAIASGVLGKAAAAVEGAMSRTLPVIISFLARLIGLGGIAKKIQEIIQKIRKPVDRALDKVIGWIINKGRALFLRGKAAVREGVPLSKEQHDSQVRKGLAAIDEEEKKYLTASKIEKKEVKKVAAAVRMRFKVFKSIKVVDGGKTWDYQYAASASGTKKGEAKEIPLKRRLPKRYKVRKRLYERGSGWESARETTRKKGEPERENELRRILAEPKVSEAKNQLAEEIVKGHFDNNAYDYFKEPERREEAEELSKKYVRENKYEVDHIKPLAKHWKDEGFDSGDTKRWTITTDQNNLQLITRSANRSKGSTDNSGTRHYFTEKFYVGPKFSSKYAYEIPSVKETISP